MTPAFVEFLAAGGNRHPSAADWDHNGSGVLAFGADRNIALWRPDQYESPGIYALLSGHLDSVNTVKFLHEPNSDTLCLVSGSADHSIRIWASKKESPVGFKHVKTLHEHKHAVNEIAVLPECRIFASASAASEILIWKIESNRSHESINAVLLQNILLKPAFFPLTLALARLESTNSIILAAAGTKSFVRILSTQADNIDFITAATLTGHEGWVRSLAFVREQNSEGGDLLLSSASQDKYIRLWRVHKECLKHTPNTSESILSSMESPLTNKAYQFMTSDSLYTITFEALLLGHEDWVFSTRWSHLSGKTRLLSASADNSLAIWELEQKSGVWVSTVRLGEISAQKGATTATGSTGGFWVGLWSANGDAVVSLGRTGSWRMWKYKQFDDSWVQHVGVTGHTKSVQAIAWAKDGSYLLSTSLDQTTRLFAKSHTAGDVAWHEFSRPQIHGYDLKCIDTFGRGRFVSGADEKLLRVFDEPRTVAHVLLQNCGITSDPLTQLPDGASIPVLGLSNKAIEDVQDEDVIAESPDNIMDLTNLKDGNGLKDVALPPLEDQLARHLLWPEIEKLYGHGYEISAVATSHDGAFIATACRATSIEHSVIRLYETQAWRELRPALIAHSLTITGLKFSPDDQYLLSVGRDRQCVIFHREEMNDAGYILLISIPKAHSRMILDAAWAPLEGTTRIFATGGRDKALNLWKLSGHECERANTITSEHSITAVDFVPQMFNGKLSLAYGLENGSIFLINIHADMSGTKSEKLLAFDTLMCPSRSITALAWRPNEIGYHAKKDVASQIAGYQLAVSSEDTSLRIYNIKMI